MFVNTKIQYLVTFQRAIPIFFVVYREKIKIIVGYIALSHCAGLAVLYAHFPLCRGFVMNKKILSIAAMIGLGLLSSACTTRQATFTIVSTKNVEVSRVDLKQIDFTRNIEGSDGRFSLLLIPFGSAPLIEEAMDECLEIGNGDFMTSAVTYHTDWSVFLFGWESWTVEGDVGNSLSQGGRNLRREQ